MSSPAWDRWQLLASPMFAALSPVIGRLPEDHFPTLAQLNRLCEEREVVSGNGVPLEFVPQAGKTGEPYEKRVYAYGKVLTRKDNWHDLFNALVWISFPKTKAAINRHHYEQMATREGGELRGAVRDALTLFDESGVIVASGDRSLSDLLAGHEWKELFWQRRADVAAQMRFYVFGHAIYEKALAPYKGLTAKCVILDVSRKHFEQELPVRLDGLDAQLARLFENTDTLSSAEAYAPLPVLGVPGWTPDNEHERYYEDAQQFRPAKKQEREETEEDAPVRIAAVPGLIDKDSRYTGKAGDAAREVDNVDIHEQADEEVEEEEEQEEGQEEKTKDKGKGKGRGKGKVKEKNKGKDKGRGKDKDKEKNKQKSKGKGKGK
jgi:hypothetical protein